MLLPFELFVDLFEFEKGEPNAVRNKHDPFEKFRREVSARDIGVSERTLRNDRRAAFAPAGSRERRNANRRQLKFIVTIQPVLP